MHQCGHPRPSRRLSSQAFHFSEFVDREGIELPKLARRAVLWGHCHHKATGGIEAEKRVLEAMGVEVQVAAGGCCGLAGSWGFESAHHDLSMRIGEEGFLPAAREASSDTLIVADGFSCRTQLEHSDVGRRALHVGQVIAMATGDEWKRPRRRPRKRTALLVGTAASAVAAGAFARRFARSK